MKKIFLIALRVLAWLGIAAGAFWFGRNIAINKQFLMVDSLLTVSSIIFGISGAWIAIIYPEAEKNFDDFKLKEGKEKLKKYQGLASSMLVSMYTLIFGICYRLSYVVLSEVEFLKDNISVCRAISFTLIVLLSLKLVVALLNAVTPGEVIRLNLIRKSHIKDNEAHYKGFQNFSGDD